MSPCKNVARPHLLLALHLLVRATTSPLNGCRRHPHSQHLLFYPLIVLYLGNQFNSGLKEREAQTKFVELAIQILRESPDPPEKGHSRLSQSPSWTSMRGC